jgi:hydroxymethylpyrimidine pyrophosphatase-like HAD family hydrolase
MDGTTLGHAQGKPDGAALTHPALVEAVRHLLQPLAKLLIANGVPYPALSDLLKSIYFDMASEITSESGKEATDSRISVISGLHRKDVKRLRSHKHDAEHLPTKTSLASEVFTRWISEPRYLNRRGQPQPLARLASAGGRTSFESLVASVSKDVRSRALLEELLRLGLVLLDDQDRVITNRKAFVPERGTDEMNYYFGQNAHDHLAAAAQNLLGIRPSFLEQGIFGDALSAASVTELEKLVRKEWQRLVREIVPRANVLDSRDAKSGQKGMRMRFGIYFFSENRQPGHPDAGTQANGGKRSARSRTGPAKARVKS